MSKILIILSAAKTWTRADGSKYESGVWAEEFVVMDEKFLAEGLNVDIATPGGVVPTIDPHSMNPDVVGQENVDHYRAYLDRIDARLAHPLVLADVVAAEYDAIVIPGGLVLLRTSTRTSMWVASSTRRNRLARSSLRCAMGRRHSSLPRTQTGNGSSKAAV